MDRYRVGWQVPHGDVDGAVSALRAMAALPAAELGAMGQRGAEAVAGDLGRASLRGRFCDVVASTMR